MRTAPKKSVYDGIESGYTATEERQLRCSRRGVGVPPGRPPPGIAWQRRGRAMKLDLETLRWIEVALEHIKYGEILITVHDHQVVGVDTKSRERIDKPSRPSER